MRHRISLELGRSELSLDQDTGTKSDVVVLGSSISAPPSARTEKPSGDSQWPPDEPVVSASKGRAFWLSFVAIMVAVFLSALDLTVVATALPTIANALHDTEGDYIWVGSAYALSSTAFIPLSGNLANVFGRKPILLATIGLFGIGSVLSGAAQNMPMLIAGRTIQGIGGGGILTLTEIVTADLVPLAERGTYQGLIAMVWALASFTGPPIGGALAQDGKSWRWIFYLNLPLAAIAMILVAMYLKLNRPQGSTREKLANVDWVGNFIIVSGTSLAIIGLTWGGIRYPWDAPQVLVPLVVGVFVIFVFGVYEAKFAAFPVIPRDIVSNRTSVSGLLTVAVHGVTSISVVYYIPVFFQACFGASPLRSSVDFLPAQLTSTPFAVLTGVLVGFTKKYRLVNWAGWAISIVGFGLFSTIRADTSTAQWVIYQIIAALGVGPLFVVPLFALLAPLPPARSGSALTLFTFTRSFAQTWGITISGTILQNMLKKNLPAAFVAQFPPSTEIAYAAIPVIRELEEPLRSQVRAAFSDSMAAIWQALIGISGLGLLLSFLMAEVPMATTVDENYRLKEKAGQPEDIEMR
ncbi:major facilitator superfamily domain-containing protein [Mycena metata]|uniref:Major facilitator superfamily domain-containing protein n=1 Tax=Mycena metata TaxID=1033252 RepID=A0AAD7K6K6_9AGAR|nr:major facilitator superfamily domain-containing protein [Mycena metata]